MLWLYNRCTHFHHPVSHFYINYSSTSSIYMAPCLVGILKSEMHGPIFDLSHAPATGFWQAASLNNVIQHISTIAIFHCRCKASFCQKNLYRFTAEAEGHLHNTPDWHKEWVKASDYGHAMWEHRCKSVWRYLLAYLHRWASCRALYFNVCLHCVTMNSKSFLVLRCYFTSLNWTMCGWIKLLWLRISLRTYFVTCMTGGGRFNQKWSLIFVLVCPFREIS